MADKLNEIFFGDNMKIFFVEEDHGWEKNLIVVVANSEKEAMSLAIGKKRKMIGMIAKKWDEVWEREHGGDYSLDDECEIPAEPKIIHSTNLYMSED